HVLAGDAGTFLWLSVIDEHTEMTTLSMIDLTDSVQQAREIQEAVKRAEGLPIRDRVQAFQGVIVDVVGAVLAGAGIRVIKSEPEGRAVVLRLRADSAGNFSAQLPDGLYLGIVHSQGFRAEAVRFEVTKEGSGDLRLALPVLEPGLPVLVQGGATR
ncbi:MAG TPA: hypothetical protein VFF50_10940, partial [Candidatus Deferrimicrobiaceae bacterium]|nr:hypothetical protein [Candidatus Deferrimicrobiaceae bacterium]